MAYLVFIIKFELFWAWSLGKRGKKTLFAELAESEDIVTLEDLMSKAGHLASA